MDDIKFVDLQNALLKAKQDGVDFDIDLLEVDNGIDEELQPVLDIEYHDQSVILSAKGSRKRLNSSSAREMSFYLPDHCELDTRKNPVEIRAFGALMFQARVFVPDRSDPAPVRPLWGDFGRTHPMACRRSWKIRRSKL